MATDLQAIVSNLSAFYDFTGKTVIDVGAGGGQLIEYARPARRVLAIDPDAQALERLADRLRASGLAEKFTLVASDLLDAHERGDVVLLEFCLHLMADPCAALDHARGLAPDVVAIGHAAGSPWSWHAAEDAGVEAAWRAVERRPIRRQRDFDASQVFQDYSELEQKLAAQGAASRERIASFRGQKAIRLPMPYRLALL